MTNTPWVTTQGISTHWLRHTTLTWVERHFDYGIARAYAGHTDNTGPATTTYIKAHLQEVATALTTMTGQPHPWPSHEPQPRDEHLAQRLHTGRPRERLHHLGAGTLIT